MNSLHSWREGTQHLVAWKNRLLKICLTLKQKQEIRVKMTCLNLEVKAFIKRIVPQMNLFAFLLS